MATKIDFPKNYRVPTQWVEFGKTFTVRELLGEDRYTEIMCQLYGYKYEKIKK